MDDLEPGTQPGPNGNRDTSAAIHPFPDRTHSASHQGKAKLVVSFDRVELREILNLYGRRVAEGEWRDYAISFSETKAVFSVYRRTSEVPLYRIEKDPSLARRQGAYAVVNAAGLILKRGHDLGRVIAVIDAKPKLVLL